MRLWQEAVSVSTSGSAGSATGSTGSKATLSGFVLAVHLSYDGSCPAGTTVTVAAASTPTESILTVTGNTDGWFYPRRQTHDAAGTALTLDGTEPQVDKFVLNDRVSVAVADCDELENAASCTIYWVE